MQPTRFDRLSQSLGARLTRRVTVATSIGSASAITILQSSRASQATPVASPVASPTTVTPGPTFLYVQSFGGGTLTKATDGVDRFLLVLEDAPASTIAFADRPSRKVNAFPTDTLPEAISFDPGDPPNAALVTTSDTGETMVIVVEMLEPTYDPVAHTLSYPVSDLDDFSLIDDGLAASVRSVHDMPARFGAASLFIDSGDGDGCGGALAICGDDSDCCNGYICQMSSVTPESPSRTTVLDYNQSFCMPASS
jgi:hypothetical protein